MVWRHAFGSVTELFFPRLCLACREELVGQERTVCLACGYELPFTNFHCDPENPMAKQLWGRFPFSLAAAMLYFHKGSRVQNLIHQLKYRGRHEVGDYLGELYGKRLLPAGGFELPEMLVPVPLHPSRQRKRGYNQSEHFAAGLSRTLGVPVSSGNLCRGAATDSQTSKNRFTRYLNMKDIFRVNDVAALSGKSIWLADDVITTGSTVEACAGVLLQVPGVRVGIVTIAFAE